MYALLPAFFHAAERLWTGGLQPERIRVLRAGLPTRRPACCMGVRRSGRVLLRQRLRLMGVYGAAWYRARI